jgi:hypothetical protein
MNKIEITVDVVTGETTTNELPFTAQELAYSEQITAQENAKREQNEATKASALAKLAALGLTQDEIKELL